MFETCNVFSSNAIHTLRQLHRLGTRRALANVLSSVSLESPSSKTRCQWHFSSIPEETNVGKRPFHLKGCHWFSEFWKVLLWLWLDLFQYLHPEFTHLADWANSHRFLPFEALRLVQFVCEAPLSYRHITNKRGGTGDGTTRMSTSFSPFKVLVSFS